jgi:Fe2+ or Zn2+ uptake regulation protein
MKANQHIDNVIHKLKFWGLKLTKVQEANLRVLLIEIALSSAQEISDTLKQTMNRINEEHD